MVYYLHEGRLDHQNLLNKKEFMSVADIQAAAAIEETETVEVVVPLGNTNTETPKKSKGRPNIHPPAGRAYLLHDEVIEAVAYPEGFADELAATHRIDAEREKALDASGINVGPSPTLDFTIQGPVLEAFGFIDTIKALYPDNKTDIKVSKVRLVPPSHDLYVPPTTEDFVDAKGKTQTRNTYAEFNPNDVYVYITVTR